MVNLTQRVGASIFLASASPPGHTVSMLPSTHTETDTPLPRCTSSCRTDSKKPSAVSTGYQVLTQRVLAGGIWSDLGQAHQSRHARDDRHRGVALFKMRERVGKEGHEGHCVDLQNGSHLFEIIDFPEVPVTYDMVEDEDVNA